MKKRVLFIGPYPPPYSGPEMGMKLLLESSLRDSFDIVFLKTNVRSTNEIKGRFDHHMILAFFSFIIRLTYSIARYRPVLAYYPNTATQVGWIGRDIWCLFICRLFKVKSVIHLRGSHLKLNFQTFHPLVKKLSRMACRSVSLALVQAECLKDQYDMLIPKEKIKILYNACETSEYDNDDLEDYKPGTVLFMGHLTQAKGYCDLIRAIPSVVEELPYTKFYFAGTLRTGENNVFFNQMTGTPLEYEDPFISHERISTGPYKDNYTHLGLISGAEKMDMLKQTDIFKQFTSHHYSGWTDQTSQKRGFKNHSRWLFVNLFRIHSHPVSDPDLICLTDHRFRILFEKIDLTRQFFRKPEII